MAQRHLITIVLLAGLVAHLAAAASTTTAKPKTNRPPPPPPQVEDPQTDNTVRYVASDIVRTIEQNERNKEPWNKTFTGADMADQFKPLHLKLAKDCNNTLPNTITDVVDAAIRPLDSITYHHYWTVGFRALMKLAVYMGMRLNNFSSYAYLYKLQGVAGDQVIDTLEKFYPIVYQAYDQFTASSGDKYCKNLEALAVIFLKELAVYVKEQKS